MQKYRYQNTHLKGIGQTRRCSYLFRLIYDKQETLVAAVAT